VTGPSRALRRRVIAAVVTFSGTAILAVVLALLGYPWCIWLAIGLFVFFWLLEPDDGSG
jgi:hypothetical protein